jgi:serine/threonine protein kinase
MNERPSPERWRQVEPLLDAALDTPPERRSAWLDSACGDDAELRTEVERLLRACETPGHFLQEPAVEFVAPILSALSSDPNPIAPGARIGSYRIVEEAGRGGMAVVYLAERDDGHFRKRVAVKVVRGGLAPDDTLLRRFREERQILAELEHPGIARLLDGGVTDEGLPWFAMEYVDGTPIEQYCDERRLSVEARLALVRAVCDAVQYAHERRIVHRDLKPGNILVVPPAASQTAELDADHAATGQVKLLDFGIAKLLAPESAEEVAERPQPDLRLMTPEYASPEQVRGDEVTSATDVYSLGVLLYRLLCGRHPYLLSGRTRQQIERSVLDLVPEPPSVAAGRAGEAAAGAQHPIAPEAIAAARSARPEQLLQRLHGDLDAIVLKALAKQPEHRYADAGDLAADLRRHVEGGAVAARHGARLAATRFRQQAVRVAVGAVAVLGLALAAGWHWRPASPTGLASDSVIAVLPFVPSVPDPDLERLGYDLAVTLAANLDGVGDLHTIIIARQADEGPGERPVETARGRGAGAIVQGRLVRVDDLVRADAELFIGTGERPAARASATELPEALAALTDSLTWTLLREVWRTGAPPVRNLEAITTRSIPALRAYLDGERLMMQSRWQEAMDAFRRALDEDPEFGYAYWRYATASWTIDRPVEPWIVERYTAHLSGFPERDRLLIEAGRTDSMRVFLAEVRAITRRFPAYWPAWWTYANRLVHDGALFGYTHAEARVALEQTLNLNPQLDTAWDHLFWLAAADGDEPVAGRALQELTRLRADRESDAELRFYRYVHHLMRSDGRSDPVQADALVRDVPPEARLEWFDQGLLRYGFPEATIDLANQARSLQLPGPLATAMERSIVGAWAARGRWDTALTEVERYADRTADPAPALYAYRLAAVGLWMGAVDAGDVERRRAALTPAAGRLAPDQRAELAWLDGLVAYAREDASGLATARLALRRLEWPAVAHLDRSLEAFEVDLQGSREQAARMLEEMEGERADDFRTYRQLSDAHPYLTAVNRFTAGRWLFALGDATTAAGLLVFHEGVPWPLPLTGHANYILAAPAYLERARIEEAAGRDEVARTYYWQFLRRYDQPVAAHQWMVDEARAAIERLAQR